MHLTQVEEQLWNENLLLKGKILEYRSILLKRITEKISQDLLPETFKQLNPDINKYPIKICLEDFDEHFNIEHYEGNIS